MNTGHVARHDGAVSVRVIESLLPLVASGGGPLPGPFGAFRVEITRASGSAAFTVYRGREPLVLNVVAWMPEAVGEAWSGIESVYLDLSDKVPGVIAATATPEQPSEVPWLVVLCLPSMFTSTAKDDLGWLGDFEKCMALSIMD